MIRTRALSLLVPICLIRGFEAQAATPSDVDTLLAPVRLKSSGVPIDVGKVAPAGHAGPALGDVDGDGDRDPLVGDFPGYFW